MRPLIVNLSRWRTEDIQALYEAALAQVSTPQEPKFLVVGPSHVSACVSATRNQDEIVVGLSPNRTGPGSLREQSDLQVLAQGRVVDDGSFGQLARYLVLLLQNQSVKDRPARRLPAWASGLTLIERPAREPTKLVRRLIERRYKLGLNEVGKTAFARFDPADIPVLLKLVRVRLARRLQVDRRHYLSLIASYRQKLQGCYRRDQRRNRYLDRIERLVEQAPT